MDNNNSEQILNTKEEQQPQPKKKTKKKIIILAVILALLLLIIGVVVYTVGFHTPDTGIGQPPPFATDGLLETEKDSPSDNNEPESDPTDPSLLPKSQQKIYNFLLIGQDRVALNTDVMMIINFNTSTKKISVIQIPRDTYIELSNYSGKINGLYAHYYLRSDKDIKLGARKLADTLEKNLCIKIHNVIHINLDGVQKIVDALGGVDLNLPNDFTYRDSRV